MNEFLGWALPVGAALALFALTYNVLEIRTHAADYWMAKVWFVLGALILILRVGYWGLTASRPFPLRLSLCIAACVALVVATALTFRSINHKQQHWHETPEYDLTTDAPPTTKGERTLVQVSPEYLAGFYREHTGFQADKLAKPYIDMWMEVSGVVFEVSLDALRSMVCITRPPTPPNPAVFAFFKRAWNDRLGVLRLKEKITIRGQISKISLSSIELKNSKIIDSGKAIETQEKIEAQKEEPERIIANVTPEYLSGFFRGHLDIQARELVKPFIGKWMKVSGFVRNVSDYGLYTMVDLDTAERAENLTNLETEVERLEARARHAAQVSIIASSDQKRWRDRFMVLRRGEKITLLGEILEVDAYSVTIRSCEIIDSAESA